MTSRLFKSLCWLTGSLMACGAAAGSALSAKMPNLNSGREAIVVYNKRLPESQALAYYYAEKRQVPTNQVFGFALSPSEEITRAEFRDELQKPLAKALSDQ